MLRFNFITILFCLPALLGFSQKSELFIYKKVDTVKLYLEVKYPDNFNKANQYPAIVFFFGGEWKTGDRNHFKNHAEYFAKRGIVCFLADYRTESKNSTTPFEALKDAKSAIRYIRKNASEFSLNPSKIIASGGSAGGQLAAATALIKKYNDKNDDLSVDCKPDALVLYSPVIDNGPGGYGYERVADDYKDFSPLHNIKQGAPPTIIFLGTEDQLIPVETARYYQKVMGKVGSTCVLKLYNGEGHGFFNYNNPENYKSTVRETDDFLQVLGYLEKNAEINAE